MKWFIVIWGLVISGMLTAQITQGNQAQLIEDCIEFIRSKTEGQTVDYSTYFEALYTYLETPLNLNQATYDELQSLHILTDIECQAIIDYRDLYGRFLSVYELGAIAILDRETIQVLLPFVVIGPLLRVRADGQTVLTKGKTMLVLRGERGGQEKVGYQQVGDTLGVNTYLGDRNRYYVKFKYNYLNTFSYAFVAEKDPGEPFLKYNKGFDFYSGYIRFNDIGPVKKFVIGDFQANFGQGLNLWTGYRQGQSVQMLNIAQNSTGIKHSGSVNESNFMRGIGVTFKCGHFDPTLFFSFQKKDARIITTDTSLVQATLYESGYHRTWSEMAKKKTINRFIIGGALGYQQSNFKINLTALHAQFNLPILNNDLLYYPSAFFGKTFYGMGIDYQYRLKKISFFGELASAQNLKPRLINGMVWQIDSRFKLACLYRYIHPRSMHVQSADLNREHGLYLAMSSVLNSHIKMSLSYDQVKQPWLTYQVNSPAFKQSIFTQTDFNFGRSIQFYFRVKYQMKPVNETNKWADLLKQNLKQSTSFRFNYVQSISSQIRIKVRLEIKEVQIDSSKYTGLLALHDLVYTFNAVPLKLYGRYAVFNTDHFDTRIYAYENDLLYLFNVSAYYGMGSRFYLMAKYKLGEHFDFWIRWGRFKYANVTTLSSGLEKIEGPVRSTLKLQMKVKF